MRRDRAAVLLVTAVHIRLVMKAIAGGRLRVAAMLANARVGCPGFFGFEPVPGRDIPISVVRVRFLEGKCVLGLSPHLSASPRLDFMMRRLIDALPLFTACRGLPNGDTWLNLDDIGIVPGLAFSAAGPDHHLIPDPIYLAERGYGHLARTCLARDPPWIERRPIAFWRGSTTGQCAPGDWRRLGRVRLCEIAATRPDLFDVGFSAVVQQTPEDCAAIRGTGFLRPAIPEADFILYRYPIDIDGNSNSWPGLFGKLLTGSPVVKVASAAGYRQWYYDRLIPWVNFVPVAADMSDLVEKVEWLMANDAEAQRIGAAGRALALSMTVPAELRRARQTIAAALVHGRG